LVLALKVLGNGRSRYHVTLTRSRHRRRCHRYRPARSPDRRPILRERSRGVDSGLRGIDAIELGSRNHHGHGTQKRRRPRSTSSDMDRSASRLNLSQSTARTMSFSRSSVGSCSFLLRKRPQFGEDDRQIFRDRRMNVHGALDDRVRRLRIHNVQ